MGCEYQYRMTNRAVLDVRETVSYFRNELQNEKSRRDMDERCGKMYRIALYISGEWNDCLCRISAAGAGAKKGSPKLYIVLSDLAGAKNDSDTPCYLWTKKSAERTAGFQ